MNAAAAAAVAVLSVGCISGIDNLMHGLTARLLELLEPVRRIVLSKAPFHCACKCIYIYVCIYMIYVYMCYDVSTHAMFYVWPLIIPP